MKFDNRKILIAIVVVISLLFPVVALTTGPLRIVLGLLFVIFFPGYTLLSALFLKRDDLSGVERIALSFGLSIAVSALIGLVLNYTPWGIRLYPILISITLFIIVTSAVGWYRQQRLPAADRFSIAFKASLSGWSDMSKLNKGLSICLVVAIVAALGSLVYVVVTPKQGEKFTEFYVLNTEGKAEDYPKQVILGEPVELIIGVANHEYQTASYTVAMAIDGVKNSQIDMGTLDNGKKCERKVSLVPEIAGKKQKLEFYLYKNGETTACFAAPLHLYIDVVTFYVLNAEGKAGDYPQQVERGKPIELIVGVVNDELQPTSYQVKIKTDGAVYKEINTGTLAYREKWEQKISFTPWLCGSGQKMEFWLYKNGSTEPYYKELLYFSIDVVSPNKLEEVLTPEF